MSACRRKWRRACHGILPRWRSPRAGTEGRRRTLPRDQKTMRVPCPSTQAIHGGQDVRHGVSGRWERSTTYQQRTQHFLDAGKVGLRFARVDVPFAVGGRWELGKLSLSRPGGIVGGWDRMTESCRNAAGSRRHIGVHVSALPVRRRVMPAVWRGDQSLGRT